MSYPYTQETLFSADLNADFAARPTLTEVATLTNKTLVAPVIGAATGTSLALTGKVAAANASISNGGQVLVNAAASSAGQVTGFASSTYVWGIGRTANGMKLEALDDFGFYAAAAAIDGGALKLDYSITTASEWTFAAPVTLPGSSRIDASGLIGVGGSPVASIDLRNDLSATAWLTSGIGFRGRANTYTDTSSSGTVAETAVHALLASTIAASSVTTFTIASGLRVSAPSAGTNVTLTNPYAIYVPAGASRFDGAVLVHGGTAIPAGGTAGAGLRVSSTANFGVFFGSGAPSLSAAKGSLYLRSDGSATNNRAYINTDSGTTWTALTTAA